MGGSGTRFASRIFTLAVTLLPATALATNGYFSHGFGTRAKAVGGVAAALPQDSMVAAANPAGMVQVGGRFDLGAALFAPDRGFTADPIPGFAAGTEPIPSGEYESSNDFFLIPHFGYNRMLDDKTSLGVSIGGNGGMNSEYQAAVFRNVAAGGGLPAPSQPTGIDLIQMFVGVTYAKEVTAGHSFGITPIVSVQRFRAEGLQPFAPLSVDPVNVTNRGYDYSIGSGLRVGWLGELTDWLTVGASYQTRTYMTKLDKYSGLLAEGGDLDIPPIFNVGVALHANPQWTFAFEYQHIAFEDVNAMKNPNGFPLTPNSLGGDDGLGFGWADADVLKFGVVWKYKPDLIFRAGYSHTNQVISGAQALFNILAPATVQDHITFGFTKSISDNDDISFSVMHAFNEKISGTNPNTGPQTGSIEMDQTELEVSWTRKF